MKKFDIGFDGRIRFTLEDIAYLQTCSNEALAMFAKGVAGSDNCILWGCDGSNPGALLINGEVCTYAGGAHENKFSVASGYVEEGERDGINPYLNRYAVADSQGQLITRSLGSIAKTAIVGEIKMWAGTLTHFDSTGLGSGMMLGWALCNGSNGTVDLRERFPAGIRTSGSSFDTVGKKLGSHGFSLTVANLPSHSHSGFTASAGSHQHNLGVDGASEGTGDILYKTGSVSGRFAKTQEAGYHQHSFVTDAVGGGAPVSYIAQCTVVAFIQYIGG